jgi:hypothetical protein
MWRQTRGAIEAIAPIELDRLQQKVGDKQYFRGYNIAEPTKTKWAP